MVILGSCTRKLGQRPSDLPILEPPLRIGPLVRRSRGTSLGIIKLVQSPQQLLVRPDREDEIDPVWRIEVARLKSERSGGKTSGNPTGTTRVKYGTDSGRPGDVVLDD